MLALALLVVTVSCGDESSFPAQPATVDVSMSEYRFDYEGTFPAGRTVVNARNDGQLRHQVVLVYLPPELPPIGQQLQSGERAVVPTVVNLPEQAPGERGSFAVDLDPGRYAFLCFVTDPDGTQHARKGMNAEFSVV